MSISAVEQINAILQAEFNQTEQLAQLLRQEREILKSTDHQALSELTDKKQPLIVQLEQLGRQRETLLRSMGFPAGKAGLEAFIGNQNDDHAGKLTRLMSKLRQLVKECRENNIINGGVINVNRQHMLKALSVLRGRDLDSGAYGPGGEYASQVVLQPLLGRV